MTMPMRIGILLLASVAVGLGGSSAAQTKGGPTTTTSTVKGTTVAPGNAAPERDARGIPVISNPAWAPAGTNLSPVITSGAQAVPNPNQSAAFQAYAAAETYPACTRTVTDNCIQTYERRRLDDVPLPRCPGDPDC
jgi:hypothetical protein